MRDSIKPVHCSDSIKPVKKYCSACQVEHHDVCGLDLPESENCPCCQDTRNIMRDH
jgi:hypothetical protein